MNDPRVTHYALGELSGAEREAFERELALSADLQDALNEAVVVVEAVQDLPPLEEGLTDDQRTSLREKCRKNLKVVRKEFLFRRMVAISSIGAIAACLVVAFVVSEGNKKSAQLMAVADKALPEAATAVAPVAAPLPEATPSSAVTLAASADKIAELNSEAGNLYKLGRYDLAEQRHDKVLAIDAGNIPALEGQAMVKAEKAKYASAIDSLSSDGLVADAAWQTPTRRLSPSGSTVVIEQEALPAASVQPQTSLVGTGARNEVASGVPFEGKIDYGAPIGSTAGIASAPQATKAAPETRSQMRGSFVQNEARSRAFMDYTGAALEGSESYENVEENTFQTAKENPLSTFSVDVDTASYANVRRFLQGDQPPPLGAIRTEELINYFSYKYVEPKGDSPFSVNLEVSRAPWDAKRELVRIGLKGRELPNDERASANLVFLVDVSGSMNQPNKLPLLKKSLKALVENLLPRDKVAIVVYAGASGLVLSSTEGSDQRRILEALDRLGASGSTNGGDGIRLAYKTARENFLKDGNNRVILCTDGDFNVGTTSQEELTKLIERERASGIFLSVLGFGTGNLKDSTMEKLADKGNGNYAYIDSFSEGRKVLVEQMSGTLFTIARDVKIQVEFNPARVAGYRLIGYENRLMAREDFNNDKKDAGDIGAGHTVTALYEIIPAGELLPDQLTVDPLKYQKVEPKPEPAVQATSNELLTVKLRYKAPDGDKSQLLEVPFPAEHIPTFEESSADFQFAAAVAAFGMKLRGSPAAGEIKWSDIHGIVRRTLGDDRGSYRAEFLTLIEKASRLSDPKP